jgi:hypothetical protein
MPTTPSHDLPYPEASDPADVPADIAALAEAVDAKLDDVDASQITGATSGQVLVADGSGVVTPRTVSGDLTLSNTGDAQIGSGAVGTTEIASSAVTTAKIDTGAVTETKIGSAAVTSSKIGTGAVGSTAIASTAVTAGKIAASAVTATEIASNAVTDAKINASAVTEAKINNGAVTESKIGSSAVTSGKIADDAVTSSKLDLSVSTDSTNTTTTASSADVNVGGLSLSLVAGVYLIVAQVNATFTDSDSCYFWIYNQTDAAELSPPMLVGRDASVIASRSVTMVAVATLAATKTVGVRLGPRGGATTGAQIPEDNASITAVRIG